MMTEEKEYLPTYIRAQHQGYFTYLGVLVVQLGHHATYGQPWLCHSGRLDGLEIISP